MQANRDPAHRRLVDTLALLRWLDAMDNRIAQHVFERWQHLVENLPIEFTRRALHSEFGTLVRLFRDLPHEARQARHVPLERHHARAHQAVLQLGGHARLLHEQALGLRRQRPQQVLEAGQIVR